MLSDYAKLARITELQEARGQGRAAAKPLPLAYFYGKNDVGATMNPNLFDFWVTMEVHGYPVRVRVLHGGRSSSKSHDAAGRLVYLAQTKKRRIVAARQFQNSIKDSFYSLILNKIEQFRLNHMFKITNTEITCLLTGSEFIFKGIARNLNDIKSLEGVDILLLEECQALTKEQFEVLEPTIRKNGSEIWLVFNPDEWNDFVVKEFIRKNFAGLLKQQINFDQNPFMSKTMLAVVEKARLSMDEDDFEHIYLGVPRMGNDKAVINLKFLKAAVDAHVKLGWPEATPHTDRVVGFDVADDGEDKNAICFVEGNIVRHIEDWKGLEDEMMKSCGKVYTYARDHKARIVYDGIGVGAGAGSKFNEMNKTNEDLGIPLDIVYEAFIAGGVVVDKDKPYLELPHTTITNDQFFCNIKAQAWWGVADRLRNTFHAINYGTKFEMHEMISFDSSMAGLDELFEELAAPHKDMDIAGRSKVESKKDLSKRGIKSPNMADALIHAFAPKEENIGFFSW